MKRTKIALSCCRISSGALSWISFICIIVALIILTAYGFSQSRRPNSGTLNSAPEEPLGLVGVALSNNIGTDIPRSKEIPVNLVQDIDAIQDSILADGTLGTNFFDDHFLRLSEFREVANIDMVSYLAAHPNRAEALDDYIEELRDKGGEVQNVANSLTQLRDLHKNATNTTQSNIGTTQATIEQAYNQKNSDGIMEGITELEELHIEEQEHTNVVVFANRFLIEYNTLLTSAAKKLEVIEANKDALAKGVTVNLPTGADINTLKDLRLFSEQNK